MDGRRGSFQPSRPARFVEAPSATTGRERAIRTLTFWMRPAFVLRALNRFQRVAGFDRAVALASSALTALIPLAVVVGAVLSKVGGREAAQAIIDRFDLTGGGAEAVRDALSPASGTSTDLSIIGVLLLAVAVLSFTRGVQRLFEQTWELKAMSVRNTPNSLLWIAGLTLFVLVSGWIHGLLDQGRLEIAANLVTMPLWAVFFVWSGRLLSAKRIAWRDLVPFGALAAVLLTAYATAALVWVPHLFNTYATRYGVIGAAFAMISALFGVMLVVVAAAVIGREIRRELDRIGRGERPADDEVRREWDKVIEEARSRWETLREQVDNLRRRRMPQTAEYADVADPTRTRASQQAGGFGPGQWLLVVCAVLLGLFFVLNLQDVTVHLLVATVDMPLIIALVIAALLGLLLGWLVPRLRRGDRR